jgi:hypothetical protein
LIWQMAGVFVQVKGQASVLGFHYVMTSYIRPVRSPPKALAPTILQPLKTPKTQ